MKYNSNEHHRRSIRLKKYDYSQAGGYFITICVQNKKCIFGEIKDGGIKLSPIGKVAHKFWFETPKHFKNVQMDEFIVMPNHIHGVVIIKDVGVQNFEPLQKHNRFRRIIPKSVGSIVRVYKSAVTHWCRENGYEYFRWQRNYYEHVVRNEDDLRQIREYIVNNPLRWELDSENPENIKNCRNRTRLRRALSLHLSGNNISMKT